ncbi:unnamed protein product [Coffea canephora]|uniref:DH200=94 genomic scaffold, scaffold_245 n=1 Tax=Coffea canephora TaxID=49390 RepID=A0A068VFN8_COFCA|nr:unnamed protein product [Coffea canephora]
MKGALVIFLTLISLVSFVKCYKGEKYETLRKFLHAESLNRSNNYITDEDSAHQYSPVYIGPQEGFKAANKIIALPGEAKGVKFDQYSGYVTVDPTAGRALFYYFSESENPSSKPLVLWLNQGRGCSSLGVGAMSGQGPFRVSKDNKTLWHNEYAWNKVANILYLESPAGAGFSYLNTDFYIAEEAYAGFFVPELAQLIPHNNKITNQTVINLKGIAMGNSIVDTETQSKGLYDFLWSHSLISDEIYHGLVSNCTCNKYAEQAVKAIGNINRYSIYAPVCSSTSNAPWIYGEDPRADDYALSHLNNPEVQKSLHANATGIGLMGYCRFINWTDSPATVLPTIRELMAGGINVWMYSGDTNSFIPVTATRYAIKKLGIAMNAPWQPWYSQGEVAGYVVEYENLTFVTLKGAGLFAPSYKPARSLAMFSSFLEGKLPSSS